MTSGINRPRKILAVADDSESQIAIESAVSLAEMHSAALEVIACVEPPHDLAILSRLSGEDPDRLIEEAVTRTRDHVSAKLNEIMPNHDTELTVVVGKAYFEIIQHVAKSGCDFVIKKAEPLFGLDRFLFASTDQHLLRKCPCPVWLQTPTAPTRPKRILATVDLDISDAEEPETLTALNLRVVEAACMLASGPDAEIIVLHAWDAPGEGMVWAFSSESDARMIADSYVKEILDARQMEMDRFFDQLRQSGMALPRLVPNLQRGAPQTIIHQQCGQVEADAIVMGTVARTGLGGVFIGNTAENIINSLDCPVLAVKPDGFISPLLR